MKIGILTFHNSRNYGAVLQAYGLKKVLEENGYKVATINYRNPVLTKRKTTFSLSNFTNAPLRFIAQFVNTYCGYKKKANNFIRFEKDNLNITPIEYLPEDIQKSNFDIIIVGSDQVWNPLITGGPDPVYWGAYKPQRAKLIAYAASSGSIDALETEEYKDVNNWIERFNAISVRERRLKDFIIRHSEKEVEVVLDPTLLAGRRIFEAITTQRVIKEPYVLLYYVESSNKMMPIARKVAAEYNAKLVVVGVSRLTEIINGNNLAIRINASVETMLSLVKYAECVVALSFHGTALSLLYEKDFYSVKGNNMARVEAILNQCNLSDRIIENVDQVVKKHVDYVETNKVISLLRQKSLVWLLDALKRT